MPYTIISSHTGGNLWPSEYGTSGTLGIFCTRDFVADDGKSFQQGNADSLTNQFVTTATITIAANIPTYGSFTLPKTDIASPITVRYVGVIFDSNGVARDFLFTNFDLVSSLGDSITYLGWWNDNQQHRRYPVDTVPTTTQMNLAIAAAITAPATTTRNGLVEISVSPVDSAHPIAVGDNDPRITAIRRTLPYLFDGSFLVGKFVRMNGVNAEAIPADDSGGGIGIVTSGASGSVVVQLVGAYSGAVLDGAASVGDYLQSSTSIPGAGHSVGAAYPAIGQVLGRVIGLSPTVVDIFGSEVRASGTNPPAGALYWAINYPSFADAVTAMGTTVPVRLIVSEQMAVAADVTVTPNIQLQFVGNGRLIVATNKTVTIQGSLLASPSQWIFDVSASGAVISFAGNRSISDFYPQWWGLVGDGVTNGTALLQKAVNSVPNGGSTFLFTSNFKTVIKSPGITIDQKSNLTFRSEQEPTGFGGPASPSFLYDSNGGNMFNMSAARKITFEGFYFGNTDTGSVDVILNWFGPPSSDINTQGTVRHSTFNANNGLTTTSPNFIAIAIGNSGDSQNCENFTIEDVDIGGPVRGAEQLAASAGVLVLASTNLNVPGAAFDSSFIGKKVWCSWATGLFTSTITAIVDVNNATMADPAPSNQVNVRVHTGNAVGVGIKNATTNGKQQSINRIRATWLDKGVWFTKGSFNLSDMGGTSNNVDLQVDDLAEPSQAAFIQTEQSLRGVVVGNVAVPLGLSYCRGANGSQLANGYYYFSSGNGGNLHVDHSGIEFSQPASNGVVFGSLNNNVDNIQLYSEGNTWAPHNGGSNTVATMGFARFKTLAESDTQVVGFLNSVGDIGIDDAPNFSYMWGSSGLNGTQVLAATRSGNTASFSIFTAQPHATNSFANEAIGFTTSTFASGNNATRRFIGFDTNSDNPSVNNFKNGGNYVGSRFTFPTGSGIIEAIAFHGKAPLGNTGITTAYGVKIEDLASVTGITNKFAFKSVGASDVVDIAGPLKAGSLRGNAVAFAGLPASPVEGMLVAVTDSNTAVWGAVIAGGGANHVLAYYNGTAWTVAAK